MIRETRPQVAVTYDPNGFYGHPDHIQAHRVTMRACELAAAEGIAPGQDLLDGGAAQRRCEAGIEEFAGTSHNPFADVKSADELPFGTPDDD